MDKHILALYNQALKDYDEAIQKLERIREICEEPLYAGMNDEILQIIYEVEQ